MPTIVSDDQLKLVCFRRLYYCKDLFSVLLNMEIHKTMKELIITWGFLLLLDVFCPTMALGGLSREEMDKGGAGKWDE